MTTLDSRSTGASSAPAEKHRFAALPTWLLTAAGVLLLGVAVWGVYGRLIHAPLIYDDFTVLNENPSLRQLWPLWNFSGEDSPLRPSPNTPVSARPLVNLSFAINYHWGGLDPTGYRLGNIGIHLTAALFLWAIVRRTLRLDFFGGRFERVAGYLGFASALVWAVHPLNTESVAYITQRTESLMGMFYLATMYAAIRYWSAEGGRARIGWLVLATILCQLGSLSKEMMASVPAVALLYERTFLTGSFLKAVRRSWPLYLGLALGWIPQIVINFNGARTPSAGFNLGLPVYIWWFTQTEVLLLYLKLAFWPWPLVIHYEIPYKETLAVAWPWLLPVSLLAVATVVLVWRRTSAGFVAATVAAVLSPTLIVPLVGEIVAERRMYVPLAAIVPLVIAGVYLLACRATRWTGREGVSPASAGGTTASRTPLTITLGASAVLAAAFLLISVERLVSYKSALILLEDTLVHQPDDLTILINLGVELAKNNRTEEAIEHFEHGAKLFDESTILNYKMNFEAYKLYYNLALAQETQGRPNDAITNYQRALELLPNDPLSHYNLGLLLHRFGMLDEARAQYEEAIHYNPLFVAAHCNLGALLASQGRYEEAIEHLEEGSHLDPAADTFVTLTDAYAQLGRSADAIVAAETAIKLARAHDQAELAGQIEVWLETYRARVGQ